MLAAMNLSHALPFAAFTFVIASAASMGIPGLSGFAAAITILIGVWKTYPLAVWITGAGMVLVAAFTLRALKESFFGGEIEADAKNVKSVTTPNAFASRPLNQELPPITLAEKLGAG